MDQILVGNAQTQPTSANEHGSNVKLAAKNLSIDINKLMEMRYMVVNALGANTPGVQNFDLGISKLLNTLHFLDAPQSKVTGLDMDTVDVTEVRANFTDIRTNPDDIATLADQVKNPVTDITVNEIKCESGQSSYEVLNGKTRLDVQINLHGKALVKIAGSNTQFYVRRDEHGRIVRDQSLSQAK